MQTSIANYNILNKGIHPSFLHEQTILQDEAYHHARPEGSDPVIHLMTEGVFQEISEGILPDMRGFMLNLYSTFSGREAPYHAMQFTDVLSAFHGFSNPDVEKILAHDQGYHVLAENALLKAVLIRWEPGKQSSIHGHPSGGCVFKVLRGRLREDRFHSVSEEFLSRNVYKAGNIAYIDDTIGFHRVENPFDAYAISLHVYTPGK